MLKKLYFVVFAAAIAAPAAVLHAAEFLPADPESAGNVVVGGTEAFRNLYAAGGAVVVNKEVLGDLFVAGSSVSIAGPVEKDLFAAGGNVSVLSPIGEDARIAGGTVSISAPVAGDLLVAGGTITIAETAKIGGDLWAAAGAINVTSEVAGEGRLAGGEIFVNGTIAGPLRVRASEKLAFGPQARVVGPVTYYGRRAAVIHEGAQVGAMEFIEWKRKRHAGWPAFGIAILWKLLALFAAGLIMIKLFRAKMAEIIASATGKPWENLGVGVVSIIVVPIVAVLLAFTFVGVYAAAMLGALFAFFVLVGGVAAVVFLGAIVEKILNRNEDSPLTWKTVLWGVLAGFVLTVIPFVGWLALFVLYLMSFGALVRISRQWA